MKFLAGLGHGHLGVHGPGNLGQGNGKAQVGLGFLALCCDKVEPLIAKSAESHCRSLVIQMHLGILVHWFTEEYCNTDIRP